MTKISVKKGGVSLVTVLISYAVAVGANALAKVAGIDIPEDTQAQVTVAVTATVSGLITGALNFWKHRKDAKPVAIPKV